MPNVDPRVLSCALPGVGGELRGRLDDRPGLEVIREEKQRLEAAANLDDASGACSPQERENLLATDANDHGLEPALRILFQVARRILRQKVAHAFPAMATR